MKPNNAYAVELICARHCSYYKPGQKEDLACQGFQFLLDLCRDDPGLLKHLSLGENTPFEDRYHYLLHHGLCESCDFLIDGCDFTDPEYTAQALPCGGYIATELLLRQPLIDRQKLLEHLTAKSPYAVLHSNCVLRQLENPYLYDLSQDELYELDEKGFEFLSACDGRQPLLGLSLEQDFLETCLSEGLLVLGSHLRHHRQNLRPSPVPSLRYLELQLTNRCNLRCKHCYLGEPTKVDLPLDDTLSVLAAFEEMQGLRVLFSGGEPLLYPDFQALNDALPGYKVRKVLLTNGTLIKVENHGEWCNFDEIQFSIDGLNEGHEKLRGPGTFQQAVRGIEAALSKGMPVSVATMVHRHNLEEFDALAEWIQQLDVVEWNIDVPCVAGRLTDNPAFLVTPEEGAPFLEYAKGGSYHGGDQPFACGYHLCNVTPEGKVLKCGFFGESPLGTLREGLEVCWNRLRPVPLTELECASCPSLLDCKGGCRFRAESPLGKDPVMCALYGPQEGPKMT